MHFRGGRHTFGGNVLVAGREISRDGEDQRGAVVHLDQLLLRSGAVGAFADGAAALVVPDRRRHNFSWPRSAVADQHGDRLGPYNFRRITGRDDSRDRLAFQRHDRAGRKEKLRGLYSSRVTAKRRSRKSRSNFFAPDFWN